MTPICCSPHDGDTADQGAKWRKLCLPEALSVSEEVRRIDYLFIYCDYVSFHLEEGITLCCCEGGNGDRLTGRNLQGVKLGVKSDRGGPQVV